MGNRVTAFEPSLSVDDLEHVLANTRDVWEPLRGRRLFITGGTGFFGKWLVESFLWANAKLGLAAEATLLVRDPAAFLVRMPHLAGQSPLVLHMGSMESFTFPAGRFAAVIHAATASYAPVADFDPLAAFDRDVQGTRRVLDFAVHCRAQRLLFTSSGAVYGRQPAEMSHISEDYSGCPHTLDGNSGYAQAKRISEILCTLYGRAHGVEATIARCFAFVGPYLPLDSTFAVGNFLRDALAGGPIRIQGDGTPYRSYLYAADLAVWLWTLLFRGAPSRAYNVGSDAPVTIAELAREVADALDPTIEIRVAQTPDPRRPALRYVPATNLAREELRLGVKIGLREALKRTAAWEQNRLRCAVRSS